MGVPIFIGVHARMIANDRRRWQTNWASRPMLPIARALGRAAALAMAERRTALGRVAARQAAATRKGRGVVSGLRRLRHRRRRPETTPVPVARPRCTHRTTADVSVGLQHGLSAAAAAQPRAHVAWPRDFHPSFARCRPARTLQRPLVEARQWRHYHAAALMYRGDTAGKRPCASLIRQTSDLAGDSQLKSTYK